MPILKKVEIHWLAADPKRGKKYQNLDESPEKWSVQIRVADKATKDALTKEHGFKFTTDEGEDGKIFYKTNLSAYTRDQEGKLNKPINVILANGETIDPNTVGNGSVANISFTTSGAGDKKNRRLVGVQVIRWVKYENKEGFELSDDYEIVENLDDDLNDVF